MIFNNYADYYNLIYEKKPYADEVHYLESLFKFYHADVKHILDLGCGTGGHAFALAEKGYSVLGVDQSADMIRLAEERRLKATSTIQNKLHFEKGDARTFNSENKFDVVTFLFHVISYQTTQDALLSCLQTAKKSLKPGGLLIFDLWHAPAVLKDPPVKRTKEVTAPGFRLIRHASPVIVPEKSIVEVHYDFEVFGLEDNLIERFAETHTVRPYHSHEIEQALKSAGLEFLKSFRWLTQEQPSECDWNACYISRNA